MGTLGGIVRDATCLRSYLHRAGRSTSAGFQLDAESCAPRRVGLHRLDIPWPGGMYVSAGQGCAGVAEVRVLHRGRVPAFHHRRDLRVLHRRVRGRGSSLQHPILRVPRELAYHPHPVHGVPARRAGHAGAYSSALPIRPVLPDLVDIVHRHCDRGGGREVSELLEWAPDWCACWHPHRSWLRCRASRRLAHSHFLALFQALIL